MMKKTFTLLMLMSGATSLFAQVNKVPLVEHFTQASCGPCASYSPSLTQTLNTFGEANCVRVSHQVSWPGTDPMNAEFPAGPETRRNYYGITGVPGVRLNGSNSTISSSTLSAAAATTTPYEIVATQSWSHADTVTVNININNVTGTDISDADKIYVSMLEKHVQYTTAPGSNGETSFEYVMRQMYDATNGNADATGGAALGTISANGTQNFNFTIGNIPSYVKAKGEIIFAVYIQKDATKEIYQAGKTAVVPIPGLLNASATANSTASSNYCDYAFTPSITFTNNDATTDVTEVVAQYTLNGGTAVTQTFTGTLGNGASTSITFPAITLSPGTSSIEYTVNSINSGAELLNPNAIAMPIETYNKLATTSIPAPATSEGFEGVTMGAVSRNFDLGIFDAPSSVQPNQFAIVDGPANSLGTIGGFGISNRSAYFGFFSISAGTEVSIVLNKMNLGTAPTITFDHAYRQYGSENDKLEVFVSTDCGATWTSVFNKAGATLKTQEPGTSSFFPTTAAEWVRNEIDISSYANTNDVVVKFTGTSDYGNNLFIDNIYLGESIATVEELNQQSFSVYPNPATDVLNVSFDANSTDYTISLTDLSGRTMMAKTFNSLSGAQSLELPVADLSNGNYILTISSEEGTYTQKVVIK